MADFWGFTPVEFGLALDGSRRREERELDYLLTAAWHGAAFERAKKLPRLETILHRRKEPEKLKRKRSPDDLLRKVRRINASLGGTDLRKGG